MAKGGSIKKKNYGKDFERQIYKAFKAIPNVSIDRIPDQVTRYKGSSSNICDFVAYKYPNIFYLECKSVHGNTLSIHSIPKEGKDGKLHGFYGDIRDSQWDGLIEKSTIPGVVAGIFCWWVDQDITLFIPIQLLQLMRENGGKSIRYDCLACNGISTINISGKKKRVFFEYDMEEFLKLFSES